MHSILLLLFFCTSAFANTAHHPKQQKWSFDGIFGKFDTASVQRGFKVYREVCSACHSVKRISFRNLTEIGFSAGEAKTIANEYQIHDGPNDEGEMFDRNGKIFDYIPGPYKNDNQAKAANGGAIPPDLSLIIKARHDGANYVYSLLTGYQKPPENIIINAGMYYNPYFSGGQIKMTPPLSSDGQVTYQDETVATVDQMSKDVVNFLQWAAEPEMQKRKSMGLKVMIFLILMTIIFYIAMKQIWRDIT